MLGEKKQRQPFCSPAKALLLSFCFCQIIANGISPCPTDRWTISRHWSWRGFGVLTCNVNFPLAWVMRLIKSSSFLHLGWGCHESSLLEAVSENNIGVRHSLEECPWGFTTALWNMWRTWGLEKRLCQDHGTSKMRSENSSSGFPVHITYSFSYTILLLTNHPFSSFWKRDSVTSFEDNTTSLLSHRAFQTQSMLARVHGIFCKLSDILLIA